MSLGARLNKRVLLQVRSVAQDEAGEPLPAAWVNVVADGDGKLWAEVRDVSGREFVAAGATQNTVLTTITIRHRGGIAAAMRVLHGADIYNIEAVLGRDGRQLLLMCSRGIA
ncbi:phage head closure protein [Janthinobacterium fluminis]|uniref:Phage head closure protein n=1 Tax=Janthinobacterium fluminis TaxID=2987524 RepID=A0ABT5JU73_9BURK|nr:phage head closure protein [Janthinobacterium fluminis]MDC8756258.1 phage head closure protein [Janthinobacterium fluminis]